MNAARRPALWSLLVLLVASVVFYGTEPASAQYAPPAPPPVVTIPGVGTPLLPELPGSDEIPTTEEAICQLIPALPGCGGSNPTPVPNGPGNPVGPTLDPTGAYPDFYTEGLAAGFTIHQNGPIPGPQLLGINPKADPAGGLVSGFATVVTLSEMAVTGTGYRLPVLEYRTADAGAFPYPKLDFAVGADGTVTGIYTVNELGVENFQTVFVPLGQGIALHGVWFGYEDCDGITGYQFGALTPTGGGNTYVGGNYRFEPNCEAFFNAFHDGAGWYLKALPGAAADILEADSRDGWGWLLYGLDDLEGGWDGQTTYTPFPTTTVTTTPAPTTVPVPSTIPPCAGIDCHVRDLGELPEGVSEGTTTDSTLASRIGGFFDDLIGNLGGMFDWLGSILYQIAMWFWSLLQALLKWMLEQLLNAFSILAWILGNIANAIISWLASILSAIINGLIGLGNILGSWIQWLLNGIGLLLSWLVDAIVSGIQVLLQWMLDGISLLLSWMVDVLLAGFLELLVYLFVPQVGLDVILAPIIIETPFADWYQEGVDTIDVITTEASPGSACGPSFVVPDPINWTVNAPTPSSSGCPGNGPGGARLAEDNAAGDIWGWRTAVRAFIALFMVLGFVARIVRLTPWAGTDTGEPAAETALDPA